MEKDRKGFYIYLKVENAYIYQPVIICILYHADLSIKVFGGRIEKIDKENKKYKVSINTIDDSKINSSLFINIKETSVFSQHIPINHVIKHIKLKTDKHQKLEIIEETLKINEIQRKKLEELYLININKGNENDR